MTKRLTTKKECYTYLGISPPTFESLLYKHKDKLKSLKLDPFSLSQKDLDYLKAILDKERQRKQQIDDLKQQDLSVDAIKKLSAVEKEQIQIEKALVELQQTAKELIDRQVVQEFLSHRFALIRQTLQSIPYQLSEELAAETSQNGVEEILKHYINNLLIELSKPIEFEDE